MTAFESWLQSLTVVERVALALAVLGGSAFFHWLAIELALRSWWDRRRVRRVVRSLLKRAGGS